MFESLFRQATAKPSSPSPSPAGKKRKRDTPSEFQRKKKLQDESVEVVEAVGGGGNAGWQNQKGKKQKRNTKHPAQNQHQNHKRKLIQNVNNNKASSSQKQIEKIKAPPSEAALALSAQLKELSSKKLLDQALQLYWDEKNDKVRDAHHGAILVDCCARAGQVEEGEDIIKMMKSENMHIPIQAQTALLKGYAHAGYMHKGEQLFKSLCTAQDKKDWPNVRTLNTLLRGCLWTAATPYCKNEPSEEDDTSEEDDEGKNDKRDKNNSTSCSVSGGIISCQECWNQPLKNLSNNRGRFNHSRNKEFKVERDLSSYEYHALLLCQALRTSEATELLSQMEASSCAPKTSGNHDFPNQDWEEVASWQETKTIINLALARSHALLGQVDSCRQLAKEAVYAAEQSAKAVQQAKRMNDDEGMRSRTEWKRGEKQRGSAKGGKRGWNRHNDKSHNNNRNPSEEDAKERRMTSNVLFRRHRMQEMTTEASLLLNLCDAVSASALSDQNQNNKGNNDDSKKKDNPHYWILSTSEFQPGRVLVNCLVSRLWYIRDGGGKTETRKGNNSVFLDDEAESPFIEEPSSTVLLSKEELQKRHITALWWSFGLAAAVRRPTSRPSTDHRVNKYEFTVKDERALQHVLDGTSTKAKNLKKISYPETEFLSTLYTEKGFVDWDKVFSTCPLGKSKLSNEDRIRQQQQQQQQQQRQDGEKLEELGGESPRKRFIELGAGSGDWIVSQAHANPSVDYFAVELKADRLAQIFCKMVLNYPAVQEHVKLTNQVQKEKKKKKIPRNASTSAIQPLTNLCCIGGDAEPFLRCHIRPQSISCIYVHHPEPPTQTWGADVKQNLRQLLEDNSQEEPQHMLHSSTLKSVIKVLRPEGAGELVVVTDNRLYGRLICSTLVMVLQELRQGAGKHLLLEPMEELVEEGYLVEEEFGKKEGASVTMFMSVPQGDTNEEGSGGVGVSYFDRLWKTGVGRYAEKNNRYVIAMRTTRKLSRSRSQREKKKSNKKKKKKKN